MGGAVQVNSLKTPTSGHECFKNVLLSRPGLCLRPNGQLTVITNAAHDLEKVGQHWSPVSNTLITPYHQLDVECCTLHTTHICITAFLHHLAVLLC